MARILIIDDEELVCLSLRLALEPKGYEVLAAKTGKAGLAVLRDHPCDLVITDIIMPEMEGIETIMNVKKTYPGVKIIAISGGGKDGYTGYLDTAASLGADDVLSKPIANEDLLAAVDRCLTPRS